tara:strand:- start:2782 stop:3414 length:633 start_codon:yes stop_codon:yes gene_type:complete
MSKRCYLDKFAKFLPEDISPNLTADQIKALSALDSKDAAKLLGRMSEIPDKRVADLMSKMLSPEQVGKVSRIGQPITENEKAAQAEAKRIAEELSPDQLENGQRAAQIIAAKYSKGDLLSEGQRELVATHFAGRMDETIGIIEQLDYALDNGNDAVVGYLWNKLTPTISLGSALMGDKNALSRALRDQKRINKIIAEGGDIVRLFENGAC